MDVNIDTADHVMHGPSGETWLVAYVQGDRLAWCGWPEGEGSVEVVAAAEREACAKVAEKRLRFYTQAVTGVPEAIRARGNT